MNTLGIDIGGSSVKGAIKARADWRTAQSETYSDPTQSDLVAAVRSVIDQLGLCERAAVCLPGKQADDGNCIEYSKNLPTLNGWAFNELFVACGLGKTTRVYSDAVAAGVDFVRTNQLVQRTACISMGTGVGLGVLEDGEPTPLKPCGAAHLGMIDVGAGMTLESVVGVPALRARFGDSIRDGIVATDLDDPLIQAVVRMIGVVREVYEPRGVVLMGGIGITLAPHKEMIERLVDKDLGMVADWSLGFGSSMFHAAMGAARLAHDD
ncbi:MAG: ROK family protein [Phycisphaerales bacterium]|nr:ROK family protein [Phycisphaerales bacterium]